MGGSVDCSNLPPHDYVDLLREQVMPIAPEGMTQVHLSDSATSANDAAIGIALFRYAMKNKKKYQNLTVMGVEGGCHGESVSTLSCSDAAFRKGLPVYDWPIAPLPKMRYPFAENSHHNASEEQRCIEAAANMINEQKSKGADVGAIIVQPIGALANAQATPTYYKKLRQLAAREGIPFIVDETAVGIGRSAKIWSHEYWYLNENDGGCADIMTFGGNTGLSGFYSTFDYRTDPMCCAYEQQINMVHLLNFGTTWQTIQNRGLLELVHDTSSFLKIELNNVERDYGWIQNVRGNGTYLGFDCYDVEQTTSLHRWLNKSGINVARIGPKTLGLRPAVVLGPSDAANLREALRNFHPNHVNFEK